MIYYTMDDLGMDMNQKETLDLSWQFERLDEIKKRLPELKLTCFTVPDWLDDGVGLSGNEQFRDWITKNKWVEIAVHGLNHRTTEGTLPYKEQCKRLKKGKEILKDFLPDKIGYKPPANDFNSDTLQAVKDCGYDYMVIKGDMLGVGLWEDAPIMQSHIQTKSSFMFWNNPENKLLSEGL